MGFFKRVTATIAANVDHAITTMENHDAVVEASLNELRRSAAKSKARLRRLRTDGERLRTRLDELNSAAERWHERAVRFADSDEAKALECLQRKRAALEQRAEGEQALAKHDALVARLSASIETIDQRRAELDRTRTLMQSRERAADAMRTVDETGRTVGRLDIDDTLERWEAKISEYEVDDDPDFESSQVEQAFLDEELHASLKAELDALKTDSGEDA